MTRPVSTSSLGPLFDSIFDAPTRGSAAARPSPVREAKGEAPATGPDRCGVALPSLRARRVSGRTPSTSRQAAQRLAGSGTLSAQQIAVLELVRAHPGRGAKALASLSSDRILGENETARRFAISRRLPELGLPSEERPHALGLIRGQREPGWRETRWTPVETRDV